MKNIQYVIELVKMDLDIHHTHHDAKIQTYLDIANVNNPADREMGIKTMYVTPDDANCIPFPPDMEDFVSMNLPICGTYLSLTVNKELPCTVPFDPCTYSSLDEIVGANPTLSAAGFCGRFAVMSHWRDGSYVGEAYSYHTGSNFAGYVSVDRKKRLFYINHVPRVQLMLQYVVDLKFGPETLIKSAAVDYLRYGVHQQLCEFSRDQREFVKAPYYAGRAGVSLSNFRLKEFFVPYDEIMDNLYSRINELKI